MSKNRRLPEVLVEISVCRQIQRASPMIQALRGGGVSCCFCTESERPSFLPLTNRTLGGRRETNPRAQLENFAVMGLFAASLTATAAEPAFWSWAKTPPMGWNSWDCYGAGVWESNVIANAEYMAQHLKPHGWDIITINIQWYEPLAHTTEYRRGAVLETDANGRLLPATNRFPMTLWCIARSPLIMGGDLPNNEAFTLALLTNDEVLAVNQNSANNRQLFNTNNAVAWVADALGSNARYVALFNTAPAPVPGGRRGRGGPRGPGGATSPTNAPAADSRATEPRDISVSLAGIGLTGPAKVRDLWNHKDLGVVTDKLTQTINSHGAGLYRVQPEN